MCFKSNLKKKVLLLSHINELIKLLIKTLSSVHLLQIERRPHLKRRGLHEGTSKKNMFISL